MKSEAQLLVKPLVLTAVLTLAFVALHQGWLGDFNEEDLLRALFSQHWSIAWPVFGMGAVVYTALGGPRQVLSFVCGYLLGGWWGGVISSVLTALGALLTMSVVRHAGMEWVRQRHAARIELIGQVLGNLLMPVGSNLLTNVAAAMAGLSRRAVLMGSLPGYLPQSLLFSYAGRGFALQDSSKLWISLVLLVVSTALGWVLYHHGFKQRLALIQGAKDE